MDIKTLALAGVGAFIVYLVYTKMINPQAETQVQEAITTQVQTVQTTVEDIIYPHARRAFTQEVI
jgi:hypothetical protein